MSLADFLKQNGYVRIALFRSGVGHFHTNGTLNDCSISVLIDTGASNTVFSFDLANEMNLPLTKLSMSGGGAGAAQLDIHKIERANFALGNFKPRISELLTLDLTHVNEALKLRTSAPIDAVLGADILDAYQAIIDYGSSSLYLKIQTDENQK